MKGETGKGEKPSTFAWKTRLHVRTTISGERRCWFKRRKRDENRHTRLWEGQGREETLGFASGCRRLSKYK